MVEMFTVIACAALALSVMEPEPFTPQGFRSQVIIEINAPVETVFDVATGDVSPWWDHSFALAPAELVIEPVFGGRFYERLEAGSDDGALHARVIYVDAPTRLTLHGPLGLSGRAVDLVSAWQLESSEDGEGTRFTVDIAISGEVDAELAGAVHRVWGHFIGVRLKPYIEAGCYHAPDAPCSAFASE